MTNDYAKEQYLTFQVSGDEYAASILQVREIIEYSAVTRVPTAPAFVRGVINLRGTVVPVVDLAVILGLTPTAVSRWSCIVVVDITSNGEPLVVGILVDAMGRVIDLPSDRIEKPPAFGMGPRVDCLRGIGNLGESIILVIDLERAIGRVPVLESTASVSTTPLEPETGATSTSAEGAAPA